MATPKRVMHGYDPGTWRLMGMGLELGALIGGVTYLGHLADVKWGTHPWLAASGAILSTVGGCYNIAKAILKPRKSRSSHQQPPNT